MLKKKILVAAIGVAFSGVVSTASAAGEWSGFYAGGSLGYGTLNGTANNYYGEITSSTGVVPITIGGGYNWQKGSSVYGVEVDISGGNIETINSDSYGGYYHQEAKWNWFSTIRGRAGMAVDNTLLYVTGGLAAVDVDYKYCYYSDCTPNGSDASLSKTAMGVVYGVGIEMAMTKHLHLKGEFLRINLNTSSGLRVNGDPADFESSLDTFRVGANWKF